MADRGDGLRRCRTRLLAAALIAAVLLPLGGATAHATPPSWRDGEGGSGIAPFPFQVSRSERSRMPSTAWVDLGPDDAWAKTAINHVAGWNDWMRDYAPDADGNWRFRPDAFESRARWASALVRAFARDETPDPTITFPDLEQTDPSWPAAAIAVSHRWLAPGPDGRFDPDVLVDARTVHRSLVLVLGMGDTAAALDELSTKDGHTFDTPAMFGFNLLAMRLGLRFNNKVDESQDVTPRDRLRRKQVAWSLYRATTLDTWVVPYLENQYEGMTLPAMNAARRSIVDWGVRYVGYPYIWAAEWGLESPEPSAFGSQPGPGFDCSGLSWWLLRRDDGRYWEVSPPRPYEGWSLPQRTSAEMSRLTKKRLPYRDLVPGDLMFYDGNRDGRVDHVDVYVGNGWSLDSSSGVGGVTLMWVETGWYRDHFVHGRRIVPRR
jgi:cell wall-associated NlpC family hydrolase